MYVQCRSLNQNLKSSGPQIRSQNSSSSSSVLKISELMLHCLYAEVIVCVLQTIISMFIYFLLHFYLSCESGDSNVLCPTVLNASLCHTACLVIKATTSYICRPPTTSAWQECLQSFKLIIC